MKKPQAVIFDMDGVLADFRYRYHLQDSINTLDKFYEMQSKDQPIKWAFELLNRFKGDYVILILTGRPESTRSQTETWFLENGLRPHEYDLHMRPDSIYCSNWEWKRQYYLDNLKDKYTVLFAVDDRVDVAKMWRDIGVTCLQCDDNNH